ncbi:MAG TPA: glutamine amidotransferase [Chloroflexota bacterium]|nr:glutamine amidotransferase [Chloroflexota bacterium]
MTQFPRLRLAYLYPRLMNLYSDTGNVWCLRQRCAWRGIDLVVDELELGAEPDFAQYDLAFIGGGEDRQQTIAAHDLVHTKGPALREALSNGLVCLAVCGGYQLLGNYYRPAEGEDLPGLGFFRAHTRHFGAAKPRCVGNAAAEGPYGWLVGFENHGGRTMLTGSAPLARVRVGFGNNGDDSTEGAIEGNAIGTYLHGSFLPKNPAIADDLLSRAFRRRGVETPLPLLDDRAEGQARAAMFRKLGVAKDADSGPSELGFSKRGRGGRDGAT